MYFKRKIDKELNNWLITKNHSLLFIGGVKRSGKTYTIKHFANKNFKNVVYINFLKTPKMKEAFKKSLNVDSIIFNLSNINKAFKFIPYETVIIFDEIQACLNAFLSLESFKEDKRFKIIVSGSDFLFDIENKGNLIDSKSNNSEVVLKMKTLDFEEFLWGFGYDEDKINYLVNFLNKKKKIPEVIHKKMKVLYKVYMIIGGYPEVLSIFLDNYKNFNLAFKKIKRLINDIKLDPYKIKDENNKTIFSSFEIYRIQSAFDLIPTFLSKKNKKYVVSKINGGNGLQKENAINYLLNTNQVFKVNNLRSFSFPLGNNIVKNNFKLYYSDISLFIGNCSFYTIEGLMTDKLEINKGYIYEAVVADNLFKANIPLYYFKKNSGLEVDFVISYQGYPTLIEVKAYNGNVKSSKTILNNPDYYGKTRLIKFGDYNIGFNDNFVTLPYYLIFALDRVSLF